MGPNAVGNGPGAETLAETERVSKAKRVFAPVGVPVFGPWGIMATSCLPCRASSHPRRPPDGREHGGDAKEMEPGDRLAKHESGKRHGGNGGNGRE